VAPAQGEAEGKNLEDFDALLESTRQANMVPEVNQEYFWQAITLLVATSWKH
jgi:hypothetical protein